VVVIACSSVARCSTEYCTVQNSSKLAHVQLINFQHKNKSYTQRISGAHLF